MVRSLPTTKKPLLIPTLVALPTSTPKDAADLLIHTTKKHLNTRLLPFEDHANLLHNASFTPPARIFYKLFIAHLLQNLKSSYVTLIQSQRSQHKGKLLQRLVTRRTFLLRCSKVSWFQTIGKLVMSFPLDWTNWELWASQVSQIGLKAQSWYKPASPCLKSRA